MDQIPTIPIAAMVQFSVYRSGGLNAFQRIGSIRVHYRAECSPSYTGDLLLQAGWAAEHGYTSSVFSIRGPDVPSIVDVLLRKLHHADAPYHAVQGVE